MTARYPTDTPDPDEHEISQRYRKVLLAMFRALLKKELIKNRELIIREGQLMSGFMLLLMKHSHTGVPWTRQEISQLKTGLKHLSYYVPVLFVFLLPFGSLILPILAEVLDRREHKRDNHDDPENVTGTRKDAGD